MRPISAAASGRARWVEGLGVVDLDDGVGVGRRAPAGRIDAHDLDEAAVTRRAAVGRHHAIGGLLLLPHPHEAELYCHDELPCFPLCDWSVRRTDLLFCLVRALG